MPDIGQVRRGLNESLVELADAADEVENSIAPEKPKKKSSAGKASSNGANPKRNPRKTPSKG
jgi:hypothetical protein